jgi:hypothetical protein
VLRDPLAVIFQDDDHSVGETRGIILRRSLPGRCFWYPSWSSPKPFASSARGEQTRVSAKRMKKVSSKPSKVSAKRVASSPRKRATRGDDLRSHYDFDRTKALPNRFAGRFSKDTVAVVLDPDVASIFRDAEAVNSFLRSAIEAMPGSQPRKRRVS